MRIKSRKLTVKSAVFADQRGVEQTLVCPIRRLLELPVGTADEQTEVCFTPDLH